MKTFSEKELKEKAAKVFDQYPTANELFATVDGNIFLMKNRAELHSKGKIYTFDRPSKAPADGDKKDKKSQKSSGKTDSSSKNSGTDDINEKSHLQLIEEAKTIETVELVNLAKDVEAKGKNRKSVIAAYDARLDELAKKIEVKD